MKKKLCKLTSSQELEDSRLRENGRDSKQSLSVRKKNSVKGFSKSIGQKFQSSQKSETSMERNGEEQLSLPGASPASLFQLPGNDEAKKMTVISGQKCSELLVKRNPVGYLQRMCLESSEWHSTRCLLIWKAKVTRQGHLLFQLVASTPRIEGIESGLLRTPSDQEPGIKVGRLITKRGESAKIGERAYDKKTGRLAQVGLPQQIVMLQTPQMMEDRSYVETWKKRRDRKAKQGINLQMGLSIQIAMLPTPNAWDGRRGPGKELNMKSKSQKDRTLETVIQRGLIPTPQGSSGGPSKDPDNPRGMQAGKPLETLGKKIGMKLQPAFVEWMMGFPIGFTDLKHSEMPLCHK